MLLKGGEFTSLLGPRNAVKEAECHNFDSKSTKGCGRWLPRLGAFATLPHMMGTEVPSVTPLGQATCTHAARITVIRDSSAGLELEPRRTFRRPAARLPRQRGLPYAHPPRSYGKASYGMKCTSVRNSDRTEGVPGHFR